MHWPLCDWGSAPKHDCGCTTQPCNTCMRIKKQTRIGAELAPTQAFERRFDELAALNLKLQEENRQLRALNEQNTSIIKYQRARIQAIELSVFGLPVGGQ